MQGLVHAGEAGGVQQQQPAGEVNRSPSCNASCWGIDSTTRPIPYPVQVFHNADGDDQSFFEYDNAELEESLGSYLHDVGEAEYKGSWARFRVDMGTCDELAIDVLINMLLGFSKDFCGLRKIYVGGANRSWPLPEDDDDGDEEVRSPGRGGM